MSESPIPVWYCAKNAVLLFLCPLSPKFVALQTYSVVEKMIFSGYDRNLELEIRDLY
jgi:hypothetical protein